MSRPVTRSTSYAPALDGPLTDARLKEVKKYAAEAKKEKAEQEKKFEEYMKEWTELYSQETARFKKARDEYDAKVVKYREYLDDVQRFGPPTNKRKVMKKPKEPEFKEPIVPNARHRFGTHFGGGRRRTQRSRGTRSTRRR